jgi:hypothetical protein
MPIAKVLKINAVITKAMLHTLDKWRTFGRTDWNQELTRQRMESHSRYACFDRRKGIVMARAVRGEARSVSIQRLGVSNCLNARERIICHPEFAAVPLRLAREESTRAHREDSESIEPPRPRNHSGIVSPRRSLK